MIRFLILLCLLCASPVMCAPVFVQGVGPPPPEECETDIATDTFDVADAAPLSINFTEAGNDSNANCPWSVTTGLGILEWDSDSTSVCDNDHPVVISNTDTGSAEQWACVVFTAVAGNVDSNGVIFRAGSTTESTSWYRIGGASDGTLTGIYDTESTSFITNGSCNLSTGTWVIGSELCARISGSGGSTTVQVWNAPGAGDPDDWAAPSCTISGFTGTDDAGGYVGIGHEVGNANNGTKMDYDNFRGGSCDL